MITIWVVKGEISTFSPLCCWPIFCAEVAEVVEVEVLADSPVAGEVLGVVDLAASVGAALAVAEPVAGGRFCTPNGMSHWGKQEKMFAPNALIFTNFFSWSLVNPWLRW